MRLLSILKGDTLHFNKHAVPVWNDIFAKVVFVLEKPTGGVFVTKTTEKEILDNVLLLTKITVFDMLFHPKTGAIKNKVKAFNTEDFYILYETIILFLFSIFKNIRPNEADELEKIFTNAVGRTKECSTLWSEMNKIYQDSNQLINFVLQKISNHTGQFNDDEKMALVSIFRGISITFIDDI